MPKPFQPCCKPLLLGSLPGTDPHEAVDTVFRYTPDFPSWPQLPQLENETILEQFCSGLPGTESRHTDSQTLRQQINDEVKLFSAEYEAVISNRCSHDASRFTLDEEHCSGFFHFLQYLDHIKPQIESLKGQIVGPLTLLTCLKDSQDSPLYCHKEIRQCAVKLLGMKAQWQAKRLGQYVAHPLIFVDEPMLFALGKPMLPEISSDTFLTMYKEIFSHIRKAGGLCGIHVCGSTDWPLVLATGVDIISFDAYHYYRELLFLQDELWHFIHNGGMLAFGIVPTDTALLMRESIGSLYERWKSHLVKLAGNSGDQTTLFQQAFITPACGTGRLTEEQSTMILQMTSDLSAFIRKKHHDSIYH